MNRLVLSGLIAFGLASTALADVSLEYRLTEGTHTYVSGYTVDQTLTIAGMDLKTKAVVSSTVERSIGKRGPDGKVKIKHTQLGMKLDLTAPGGITATFDSDKPDAAMASNPALQPTIDGLKALKGLVYSYTVTKSNVVESVEGVSALPEAIGDQFKLERVRQQFAQEVAALGDKPVKKGDRWLRMEQRDLGGGQVLHYETYYEYQGTVEKGGKTYDKVAIFISTAKLVVDAKGDVPAKVTKSDLKIESSTGSLLYDRERGIVVSREGSTRITGPLTLDVMGMELPAMLDLTMGESDIVK